MKHVASAVVVAGVLLQASAADAHVSVDDGTGRFWGQTCGGTTFKAHWDHGVVPVYLNTSSTAGVQLLAKAGGGYWTVNEVASHLRWGLAEFNESVGVNLRFAYAGTTTSLTVTNGVVIRASATNSVVPASASPHLPFQCVSGQEGRVNGGHIDAYVYTNTGANRLWTVDRQSGTDIALVFTHELLHVAGLHHPEESTILDSLGNPYHLDVKSVLRAGVGYVRHYTRYDRDVMAELYGAREGGLMAFVSNQSTGGLGTSWTAGFAPAPLEAPRFRGGKASEGWNWTSYAWIDYSSIEADSQTYDGTRLGSYVPGSTLSFSPPAIVNDTGNGTHRMYYVEMDPDSTSGGASRAYARNTKRICSLSSSDGTSWGSATCLTDPSSGADIRTTTDAVSATFDPGRKVFIVTWLEDDESNFNNLYRINMMTIPGYASLQTASVRTLLTTRALETPSVACRATGTPRCLMVYMPLSISLNLTTARGYIDNSGAWVGTSSYETAVAQVQSPAISYQLWDDQFVVAYLRDDMKAILTRKSSITGTWGNAVTAATSLDTMSAPALGNDQMCLFGCSDPRVVLFWLGYTM